MPALPSPTCIQPVVYAVWIVTFFERAQGIKSCSQSAADPWRRLLHAFNLLNLQSQHLLDVKCHECHGNMGARAALLDQILTRAQSKVQEHPTSRGLRVLVTVTWTSHGSANLWWR